MKKLNVNTVQCKKFEMWNWSPMMLIGKTPKIKFVCGKCGKFSEGRSDTIGRKGAYIQCKRCGTMNTIPIKLGYF